MWNSSTPRPTSTTIIHLPCCIVREARGRGFTVAIAVPRGKVEHDDDDDDDNDDDDDAATTVLLDAVVEFEYRGVILLS